ncbi:MAG: glutamine synthetase, partial [Eubacteriaceae bacterium]|nr:glutamine synthetase [Eubacteriaceae bacterium]
MQNSAKESVSDLFGSKVFNSSVMRQRLPKQIYKSVLKTINEDLPLEEN